MAEQIRLKIIDGPGKFDLSVALFNEQRVFFTVETEPEVKRRFTAHVSGVEQAGILNNWILKVLTAPQNQSWQFVPGTMNYSSAHRTGELLIRVEDRRVDKVWVTALLEGKQIV